MSQRTGRILLLAAAIVTLLTAIWAGLLRYGWTLPTLRPALVGAHGPLMVSGFLGTLIGLERAVGLRKAWAYAAPVLTGAGALALIFGLPGWAGAGLIALGSLGVTFLFIHLVRRQPELHNVVMALGAGVWLVGNLLWLFGFGIADLVAWWAGFLVLTIAGERLELSRILKVFTARSRALFMGLIGLYVVGSVTILFDYTLGWRVAGAAMLALAAWLLREDAARRTIKQPGLTGFIATCMLSGYLWLGAAGLIALRYGFLVGGLYDAVLHAIFLGFVFAMVFGHAPIIFPAVLGLQVTFRPILYAPLVALHASLLLRVGAGLLDWYPGRRWGGMLNGVALLLFLGYIASDLIGRRKPTELD